MLGLLDVSKLRRYHLPLPISFQVGIRKVDVAVDLELLPHVLLDDEAGGDRRVAKHSHVGAALIDLKDGVRCELGVISLHVGALLRFVLNLAIGAGDQEIIGDYSIKILQVFAAVGLDDPLTVHQLDGVYNFICLRRFFVTGLG